VRVTTKSLTQAAWRITVDLILVTNHAISDSSEILVDMRFQRPILIFTGSARAGKPNKPTRKGREVARVEVEVRNANWRVRVCLGPLAIQNLVFLILFVITRYL